MSEAAKKADFSGIRYAQVWEDADILLDALRIRPGASCLSIASAGDNALALLARDPGRVVAIDLSPAQLHCLALRVAAFRTLDHPELLELVGSRPSGRRADLYLRCRGELADDARSFWDARPAAIAGGIGAAGRFENYFKLFRRRVLPLVHPRRRVEALLEPRPPADRARFYDRNWNSLRWRLLFRIFFSRAMMGRFGRDPAFFDYVEGPVSDRILERARYALSELDPARNPYLQWILFGEHRTALPFYLREENFERIRGKLDRIDCIEGSIEDLVEGAGSEKFDAFNLSDIFEYMSDANTEHTLRALLRISRPGARLAYWNMLAPRGRPPSLADRLQPLDHEAEACFARDKAFFYSRFVIEEVQS